MRKKAILFKVDGTSKTYDLQCIVPFPVYFFPFWSAVAIPLGFLFFLFAVFFFIDEH